jgi:hypothetical protein
MIASCRSSDPLWFAELSRATIVRTSNQPYVFCNPKTLESFMQYFSRNWRNDAIQRAYPDVQGRSNFGKIILQTGTLLCGILMS